MQSYQAIVFAGLVFACVLLLSAAVIIPTVSSKARADRKIRKRVRESLTPHDEEMSLIRDGYTSAANSTENALLGHSAYQRINQKIKHAGLNITVNKVVMMSALSAVAGMVVALIVSNSWVVALVAGSAMLFFPYYRLCQLARRRLELFESQLPEALDVMSRALKVGHPFNETLHFVSEELENPIAEEFGRVFSDMNYGMPSKSAFHSLLERVPSVSLQTLVTAVLIQQESGGALAEILEKVSTVIRGRFKLQRKLRSLSAEGRMSAWVLTLIPFALAGMLMIVSPDYLPVLLSDELGQKIIVGGIALVAFGAIWIKFIINIKV